MAYWISKATGNFSSSSTWEQVDSTSLNDTEAANTALTTSFQTSSTFTPGAITIDGIAVKLASVAGSPTGTIDVALDQGGSTVTGTDVQINVSDLPACSTGTANNEGGWVFFKFSSSVTLTAATAYSVKAKTSSSSQVNLYSTSGTNWARMLRTTTTGNPAAADQINIIGEMTGAGTHNSFTVTMDNTSTTAYGVLTVGQYGTLTYGTSASTNYNLRLAGNCIIYRGGIIHIGTSGTPMPSTSSGVIEFNCASVGQYGMSIRNGGTFDSNGNSIGTTQTTLTADVAANASTFSVAADTGWAANDQLIIASTTRTATDTESVTIGSISSLTITVGTGGGTGGNTVKAAHGGGGTSVGSVGITAEVAHLTRNVKVRSTSSTNSAYIYIGSTGIITSTYTEFYYLGANTTGQRGIEFNTTGTCSITYSSIHDCPNFGVYISNANSITPNNITFSNNNNYNLDTGSVGGSFVLNSSGGNITINNNYWIGCNSQLNNQVVNLQNMLITFNNNTVAGSGTGSSSIAIDINGSQVITSFSGNVIHSNTGIGVRENPSGAMGTVSNLTGWRNNGEAFKFAGGTNGFTINTMTAFGNTSQNINISQHQGWIVLTSLTLDSDPSFSTNSGIAFNSESGVFMIQNSKFGTNQAHAQKDFAIGNQNVCQITCINCTLGSSTQVSWNNGNLNTANYVRLQRNGQTTAYKTIMYYGTITANQTTRHTASGYSWQLTPANNPQSNYNKLVLPGPGPYDTMKAAVNANSQVTISCYVYYDASYNGNMPRLIIKGGILQGIASDVIATAPSSSSNTWNQLTVQATPTEAGAIEFVVDCDGSAGNVYVDDFSVSQ